MNTQTYIEEVEKIIDSGAAAVLQHQQDLNTLDGIIASLQAAEQSFYSQIQIGNIHSAADLNRLIQTLDSQASIGSLLPNGVVEEKLSQKYNLQDTSSKMGEEERDVIRAVMNKLLEKGLPLITRKVTDARARATVLADVKQKVFAALQMGINVTVSDKTALVDINYIQPSLSSAAANELLGYTNLDIKLNSIRGSMGKTDFDFTYKEGSRELATLSIKEDSTLDNLGVELRQYLLSIAPDVLGPEYKAIIGAHEVSILGGENKIALGNVTIEELKQDTINIVKAIIPQHSSAISHFADQIAINRSISGIRGFLGELRASLLMVELFGNSAGYQLVSTGLVDKIRLTENGQLQEAPLDFVVKSLNELFGIQVKNTADISYSWSGEMSAASFYLQRLQVNMSEEEKRFFGAYSYNKPLPNDEVTSDWEDWRIYSREIYGRFQNMFSSNFTNVFKSLVGNIIRLSTSTSGENMGIFSGETSMTNNFFIMKDKIIAASDIMIAARDAITSKTGGIRSSFVMNAGDGSVWKYGSPSPSSTSYSANITTIDYDVTLKYKTLAKSAYNLS